MLDGQLGRPWELAKADSLQRQRSGGKRAHALSTRIYSLHSPKYATWRKSRLRRTVVERRWRLLGGWGIIIQGEGIIFLTLAKTAICGGLQRGLGHDDAR